MEVAETLEFVATCSREYMTFVIGTFLPDGPQTQAGRPADMAHTPRLWLFAVISIVFGSLAFGLATGHIKGIESLSIQAILFTLWMWVLFSTIVHLLLLALRGRGTLWDTVFATLCVLPSAYLVSSLFALTLVYFSHALSLPEQNAFWPIVLFLGTQFLVISYYLPKRAAHAHGLAWRSRTFLTVTLPTFVFAVNAVVLLNSNGLSPNTSPVMDAISVSRLPPMGMLPFGK